MPRSCFWLSLAVGLLLLTAHGQAQDGKDEKDANGKSLNLGANKDMPLVQKVLTARRQYQESLEELRKHYIGTGDIMRARWAEEELLQYHRMSKQAFRLDMVVPPPTLKADRNIPEANKLFREAKGFKDKGWGNDYIDNQRRAEILFQKILTKYYESDKIDEVAYHLGDLYESRAFQQYAHAAAYFERCYEWNPKTQTDARLRAARLYERQLNDRGKAADIYRLIIKHETDDRRIEEARRRLQELGNRR